MASGWRARDGRRGSMALASGQDGVRRLMECFGCEAGWVGGVAGGGDGWEGLDCWGAACACCG